MQSSQNLISEYLLRLNGIFNAVNLVVYLSCFELALTSKASDFLQFSTESLRQCRNEIS